MKPDRKATFTALSAAALIALILLQPNHPQAMQLSTLAVFPLELLLITLLLILAPAPLGPPILVLVAFSLTLMPLVKIADFAAFLAFSRPFNPILDAHLLDASWNMATGAIGVLPTLGVVAVVLTLTTCLAVAVWWGVGGVLRMEVSRKWRRVFAACLVPSVLLFSADLTSGITGFDPPGSTFNTRLVWDHARAVADTRKDLERFRAEAATDTYAATAPGVLLDRLRGTDVFLVFVESYGRSTHQHPLYAPTIRPRLETIAADLRARGYDMRSGWLTSPIVGGQSWLAHATFLSGLEIDSQRRYQALIASPRRTLLHFAAGGGWRTVGIMPAITLAWPEGSYFGYDAVHAAADLGYRGKPFNWVTMPDQFTLAAFERLELADAPRAPVFAEIALISSHAPWTPVPSLIPWETVGDGTVFDAVATSGDPPEVVWRSEDRIRDQFRQAIDYALETVGSFGARRAGNAPLIVVLGDHEPVPFVSGGPENRDVPIHLIGPPDVIAAFDAWGWTPGLLPASELPAWPMADFRDRFVASLTVEALASDGAHGPLSVADSRR
jgi:hypothetical protein